MRISYPIWHLLLHISVGNEEDLHVFQVYRVTKTTFQTIDDPNHIAIVALYCMFTRKEYCGQSSQTSKRS